MGCILLTLGSLRAAAADQSAPTAAAVQTAGTWSRDDAAHLLRRAAFGGTPQQIDAIHALGREAAVEYLLTGKLPEGVQPIFPKSELKAFEPTPNAGPDENDRQKLREMLAQAQKDGKDSDAAKKLEEYRKSIGQRQQRTDRQDIERLKGWWVDRMIRTDRPLEEKMSLFWHNLFTSGYRDVKSGKMMFEQNDLFHKQALDNYRKLTHSILHDGAMLRYLNNDQNVKGKPNENLARELMELFTLGEGNGYNEQDIKEVARALTGLAPAGRFGPQGGGRGPGGPVVMRPFMHDDGEKTIFGKTGNFGPDDVIELIFAKPEPAKYLARRLWIAFAAPEPTDSDLDPLVKAIHENNYDLVPVLRVLFNQPAFYSDAARFVIIKSPTELAVGTMRLLARNSNSNNYAGLVVRQMQAMDQELLQPPNVRGWVGGDNWITAATLFTRYNTATLMVAGGAPTIMGRGPNGQQPTPEQIQARMQQMRAGRPGGPPQPGGAAAAGRNPNANPNNNPNGNPNPAGANPDRERMMAERQRMMQDPKLREQMMQQFGRGFPQPIAPVAIASLFPKLDASPTSAQVVDAAIERFLQRPLHPDKRQALLDELGNDPIKIGTPESDTRIRQVIGLVMSTPEYQVE